MLYVELDIHTTGNENNEILISELGDNGFDFFEENELGLKAYIPKNNFTESHLKTLFFLNNKKFAKSFSIKYIEDKNWNEEWEKNFEPIIIDNCIIRAPFHSKPAGIIYDIIIEPKMSFGTGHHETTSMMVELLLGTKLKDKTVLDMGCGTGILSILSSLLDAKHIDAVDNDEWAYNNSIENIKKNNIKNIGIYHDDINFFNQEKKYDFILANINRNILLNQISHYAKSLNKKGFLYMSGFYLEDLPIIKNSATQLNFEFIRYISKNNWIAVVFELK